MITANINDFYQQGATEFILQRPFYNQLKSLIDKEAWVQNTWTKTNNTTAWSLNSHCRESNPVPEEYRQLLTQLANDQNTMGSIKEIYDFEVMFADCWDGSVDLDWHWDGTDQYQNMTRGEGRPCEAFLLLYFTDVKQWKDEMGGHLQYATRSLEGESDPKEMSRHDSVEASTIRTVYPNNRQCLLVNNMNPMFVHRTTPLKPLTSGSDVAKRVVLHVGLSVTPAKTG